MNVQLNNLSDTRKSLVVTLEPSEVDGVHQSVVKEFTQMARLPGFRPGKAPAAIVAKRYAKEIEDEFKQKVVGKAYRDALEQEKLDVLNIVKVDPGQLQAGQQAALTIVLDVRPEIALPEYVGLPTEIRPTDPTDQEVDAVIEGLRGERAEFKTVERAAVKGDYLKLAYEGQIDGKPIAEIAPERRLYGSVPQTWEEVEGTNDGVIPGLGQHLGGLKAGDKKDVGITFPGEFPAAPELAGKSAVYAVTVQEVRARQLPEIDEAFLKSQRADDLEGLKANVRNELKARIEAMNRAAQRRQVSDALVAKANFPVPDSLVDSETQSVLRSFIEENLRRGVAQEQLEKDKKALFEGARKSAEQRVKIQLLLAKIAEAEKLQVTNEDLDEFIYREAMRTQQKPDKIAKVLGGDREQLRAVQQSIIFDKAIDFLVSKATVSIKSTEPGATAGEQPTT
ncbi:MAG TPA: trigger factor [Opitutus sp.]|nr:trigger factor [Opitutus sp.]